MGNRTANKNDVEDLLRGLSHKDLIDLVKYGGNIDSATELTATIAMIKDKQLLDMHQNKIWFNENRKKWCTYINDLETGERKLIRYNKRRDLEKVLCDHYRVIATNPTFGQVYMEWITSKLEYGEITKSSADRYETDYNRFFRDSGFEKTRIKDIDRNVLTDLVKKQIAEHELSQKTFGMLKVIISGVMKYAQEREYTDFSVTTFFGDLSIGKNAFKKKYIDPDCEVLREDEIPQVKDYLLNHGTIHDLGVLLQLQTGLRVGELSALKHSDWSGNSLKVRRTEVKYRDESGKWCKDVKDMPKTENGFRDIILTESAITTLTRICELNPRGPFLFQNDKGKRILGNTFNKRLSSCLRDLGLQHRTSHKLRKTYASELHDGGADDAVVQRQMGHSSIETTRRYYYGNKTREDQIRQVQEAITY